jgi:hypothetical protein
MESTCWCASKRHSRKRRPHCPGQGDALQGYDGMVLTVAVTGSDCLRGEPQPECCIEPKAEGFYLTQTVKPGPSQSRLMRATGSDRGS